MKKLLILYFLCILLIGNLFIISIVNAEEKKDTRTVSDFISDDGDKQPALIKEFESLDGGTRNQIIENSKNIGKQKNTFVEKIARDISARIYNEALKNEYLKQNLNILLPDTVAQIKQLNLLDIKDYETFKKLAIKAGIDLNPKDLNKLLRGSLTGFDSPDLKWTTQKTKDGKSLNVIGNPESGVWLNLEDVPMGTEKMEYDSQNKQFVLTMKDGGKIVVGKGVVNSDGQFKAFSKVDMEGIGKSFSKNPNFKMDLKNLEVKKGEVILGEDKIELKGETQVIFGEFTFNRKKDESSQTSIIKFDGNKILLTGTEMKYDTAEKIGSTTIPFLYIQGDYKKEAVKVTSVEDAVPGTVYGYNWKKIYQKYDESGKLIGLSEDGNTWVGLDNTEGLNKLSKNYGDFTKQLVSHIVKKEGDVTYSIIDEAFYTSGKLKEDGRQLITEQLYENFYARNGNQLDIGGKGNVELLKSSDILRVHDAIGFDLQVGENAFSFSEKGLSSPTKPLSGEIEIPFIDQLSNNQIIKKYSLTKDSSGKLIFNDDRKTVYLGGDAFPSKIVQKIGDSNLKLSMSPSMGISMDEKDFSAVKTATEASSNNQRETMIQSSLGKSSLTLRANLGLDVEGITINSNNFEQYVKDNDLGTTLSNLLVFGKGEITSTAFKMDDGNFYKIRPEIVDTLFNALIDSTKGMGIIDLSKLSVEITRDSTGASQLTVISGNTRGKSVPMTTKVTTTAGTISEDMGRTALEAVLRAPDTKLGDTLTVHEGYLGTYSSSYSKYGLGVTRYAFESQMGSGRLGLSYEKWSRLLYKPDALFFNGEDIGYGIRKPTKTGTGLLDRWLIKVKK